MQNETQDDGMSRRSVNAQVYRNRVERVLEHINVHLDEPLTLARLSAIAGVSPFHLHHQFSAVTGVPLTKLVQLLRLKRASMRLVFQPRQRITDIAFEAGFENAESFSRAFRRELGQTPRAFRYQPRWDAWRARFRLQHLRPRPFQPHREHAMDVRIVDFPETRVAALEHRGAPEHEYETVRKFVAWRVANRLSPDRHRSYGLHYNDPRTAGADYRMDVCVSMDRPVPENADGVVAKVIPGGRCAVARYVGSRDEVRAAVYLYETWLPSSGETLRECPVIFHYVNVGPNVPEHEMITDVYLPIV